VLTLRFFTQHNDRISLRNLRNALAAESLLAEVSEHCATLIAFVDMNSADGDHRRERAHEPSL
jgi:hypothetical protein